MLDTKNDEAPDDLIFSGAASPAGLSRIQVLRFLRDTNKSIVRSNYTIEFGEARFSTWDHCECKLSVKAAWLSWLMGSIKRGHSNVRINCICHGWRPGI